MSRFPTMGMQRFYDSVRVLIEVLERLRQNPQIELGPSVAGEQLERNVFGQPETEFSSALEDMREAYYDFTARIPIEAVSKGED